MSERTHVLTRRDVGALRQSLFLATLYTVQ